MSLAANIVSLTQSYLMIGLAVAAAFLVFGIERIDTGARASYVFRTLLVPGIAVLWPVVLVRWIILAWRDATRIPNLSAQRRTHVFVWSIAAVVLPLIVIGSLALKYGQHPLPPNQRIDVSSGGNGP